MMILALGFIVVLVAFLATAVALHETRYQLGVSNRRAEQAEIERDAYEHTIDMMGWELISTTVPRRERAAE